MYTHLEDRYYHRDTVRYILYICPSLSSGLLIAPYLGSTGKNYFVILEQSLIHSGVGYRIVDIARYRQVWYSHLEYDILVTDSTLPSSNMDRYNKTKEHKTHRSRRSIFKILLVVIFRQFVTWMKMLEGSNSNIFEENSTIANKNCLCFYIYINKRIGNQNRELTIKAIESEYQYIPIISAIKGLLTKSWST